MKSEKWAKEKNAQLPSPKTTEIYSWPFPHFCSAKQLVSRNEMFSWKYQLRLLNFFNDPYCSVIYSKRMAWLQEQGPELHRVPACWASFLCQAQVNMSPVDADSWNPLFNYTVYEHWVHTVPEDFWFQTCLQIHKVLLLLLNHWSRTFWCQEHHFSHYLQFIDPS